MTSLKNLIFIATCFFLPSNSALAEEVKLPYNQLTLNANLVLAENSKLDDGVILMTHGTFGHNKMEIMETLQVLFSESGINTLAINLSLGINDRHGRYDCSKLHRHRHTDAIDEIDVWVKWLKEKGVENIVLLGHSRGGNQTALYLAQQQDPAIKNALLISPSFWDKKLVTDSYKKRHHKNLNELITKADSMVKSGKENATLDNIGMIYCTDTNAVAKSFTSYYDEEPRADTVSILNEINSRVLVFSGTEDIREEVLNKNLAHTDLEDNIELKVIDGADHYYRDLYSDEIVETAIGFLSLH